MKLYVINKKNQRVYLNLTAPSRQALAKIIGGKNFYLGEDLYSVNDVLAESENINTATGAVVGGLVGVLGGPAGILIGGLLGGIISSGSTAPNSSEVQTFNDSK